MENTNYNNNNYSQQPNYDPQSQNDLGQQIAQIKQNQRMRPKQESLVSSLLGTISRMALVIVALLLIIGVIVSVGSGLWLQTYKAFTKEKLVAIIEVESLKTDGENRPYFKMNYIPVDNPSALTKLLAPNSEGSDSKQVDKATQYYIHGDRFMVEAEVINFGNLATLLGSETIYKVTRIQGQYRDTYLQQEGKKSVYDVNGGIDPIWEMLEYNQEILQPYVKGVYGSAVTQGVRKEPSTWNLYMTNDGLIIKAVDSN